MDNKKRYSIPARRGLKRSLPGRTCPFSPSCFECPKEDCVAPPSKYYNEILDSEFYFELLLGRSSEQPPAQ